MFQKIDVTGKLAEELVARTHEVLQPNPGMSTTALQKVVYCANNTSANETVTNFQMLCQKQPLRDYDPNLYGYSDEIPRSRQWLKRAQQYGKVMTRYHICRKGNHKNAPFLK